jgi:ABC-type microcin C transport system permease subunit YejE
MSSSLIGLGVGAVLGVAGYRTLQVLRSRVEMEETRKVLHIVSMIDLISFPIIGFVVGAYVFG